MGKEHWVKIGAGLILFLLSLATWVAQMELTEIKSQVKAVWQANHSLSERMAHLEGFHEGERCYTKDKEKK